MRQQNYRILAIVPYLRNEKGHYHSFHLAADEAATSLGWEYIVAAPDDTEVKNWPSHWQKCLDLKLRSFKPRWLARFYEKHVIRTSLTHFLKKNSLPGDSNILFIEDPSTRMLRLLMKSLALLRTQKLTVWIHWHSTCDSASVCRWVKRLGLFCLANNPILTAMTDSLAQEWQEALQMPVGTVPHPTQTHSDIQPLTRSDDLMHCWWPGSPYRWKGQDCIQRLLNLTGPAAARLKLICSAEATLVAGQGAVKLQHVAPMLEREEYLRHMTSADLILLPYEPGYCAKRFSGILLEAIQLGKIPVVQDGTWMAQELRKYHLSALIIDWSQSDLAEKLISLATDHDVQTKIQAMQQTYRHLHCSSNFARALLELHGAKETVVPFPSTYIVNEQSLYSIRAVE